MKLIFLGPPGAGKGTQAAIVSEKLSIPTISTGDMLRAAIAAGTEMGKQAQTYMDKGHLVPDEVIIGMVVERVSRPDCQKGYILDGVPRTIAQAEALEAHGIRFDHVLSIESLDDTVIGRLTGRRVCPNCRAIYHIKGHPTKVEGICDVCGTKVVQRADDTPETVRERLEVYHTLTAPLKDFYRERGLLREVKDTGTVADTNRGIMEILEGK
ncbi:MAG: adenylate kinase [Oscillospiraceae bacterium]|nr:adenylate kinase [Oscillospiraceae bacterium]MBP3520419.1 adenylate kinase [Oscillospiraceae bacterium]